MRKKITQFLTKKIIIGAIGAIVVIGGGYAIFSGGSATLDTVTVKRGTVAERVTVTGKTKPVDNVDLAFERSGRVTEVNVKVGDTVKRGTVLLALDQSELGAQLQQAQASLLSAQATLDQLKRGPRPEDVQVKQTEIAKAKQDLDNEYGSVFNLLQDSYNSADGAIRRDLDDMFTNDEFQTVSLTFDTTATQKKIDALTLRVKMGQDLNAWRTSLNALQGTTDTAKLDAGIVEANGYLSEARTLLNSLMDATINGFGVSTSTLNSFISSINTGRTSINSAITSLSTQSQTIASQKVTVKRLQDELALKLAGNDPDQIRSQEAVVKQAEANVNIIYAQLSKLRLVAPIDGVITKQDAKRGEIIAANTSLVSVISQNNLEIEANVPEVDVAKIMVGNNVDITLDAFPGEHFTGSVVHVDPAETIVDGVVNYKITITFVNSTEANRVKSGLTANLAIETLKKEGVLVLPQYALREKDNGVFVDRRINGAVTSSPVTIGIRSTDGMVEIVSGVNEGDEVLNIGAAKSAQ